MKFHQVCDEEKGPIFKSCAAFQYCKNLIPFSHPSLKQYQI